MTIHDKGDPLRQNNDRMTGPARRDNTAGWVMGALAAMLAIGILIWSMSGDRNTTAQAPADRNTGAATRTAPTPAPATPAPAPTPARP